MLGTFCCLILTLLRQSLAPVRWGKLGYRDVFQAHSHTALCRMPWRCGIDLRVLGKEILDIGEVIIFKYNNLSSGNISIILFFPTSFVFVFPQLHQWALYCWSFSHLLTYLWHHLVRAWELSCGHEHVDFQKWKNPQLKIPNHLPSGHRGNLSLGSGLHLRHLNLMIFQPKPFCDCRIVLPV